MEVREESEEENRYGRREEETGEGDGVNLNRKETDGEKKEMEKKTVKIEHVKESGDREEEIKDEMEEWWLEVERER